MGVRTLGETANVCFWHKADIVQVADYRVLRKSFGSLAIFMAIRRPHRAR